MARLHVQHGEGCLGGTNSPGRRDVYSGGEKGGGSLGRRVTVDLRILSLAAALLPIKGEDQNVSNTSIASPAAPGEPLVSGGRQAWCVLSRIRRVLSLSCRTPGLVDQGRGPDLHIGTNEESCAATADSSSGPRRNGAVLARVLSLWTGLLRVPAPD